MSETILQSELNTFLHALGVDTSLSFDIKLQISPDVVSVVVNSFVPDEDGRPMVVNFGLPDARVQTVSTSWACDIEHDLWVG